MVEKEGPQLELGEVIHPSNKRMTIVEKEGVKPATASHPPPWNVLLEFLAATVPPRRRHCSPEFEISSNLRSFVKTPCALSISSSPCFFAMCPSPCQLQCSSRPPSSQRPPQTLVPAPPNQGRHSARSHWLSSETSGNAVVPSFLVAARPDH